MSGICESHFNHVCEKFQAYLAHDPHNMYYIPEFLTMLCLQHLIVTKVREKRCIPQKRRTRTFSIGDDELILFNNIESREIANEILRYIKQTEILFT